MTISKDTFLAILAMVSYNQGYGRGIEHGKTQIGSATAKSLISSGVNQEQYQAWQDAGFYAIAYDVDASGVDGLTKDTTVISYRGKAASIGSFVTRRSPMRAFNAFMNLRQHQAGSATSSGVANSILAQRKSGRSESAA